ncbi:MAG TPA: glycine--tRNA ligase subunit beta, partial [Alphaproteobacteria bacterium]|nr:glycine--tRNA ligase subunit beta [Alphaproteobacteria bacterium]
MPAVAARKRKMIEFFLEIASEEIPPRMQKKSLHDLEEIFCKNLAKMNLSYEKSKTYITSRRMALIISGLPIRQQDVVEEKRGPGVYADKKAITGFLKSNSISINQCIKKSVKGKEYYFATITNKGSKTEDIIKKILDITFKSLVWPKSMRWGEGSDRWVRPIKNLVCIFNGKT